MRLRSPPADAGDVSWQPPLPLAAPSAPELLASLGTRDRLVGYEAILVSLIETHGSVAATACLRSARPAGSTPVPSVLLLLDDAVVESWLEEGEVVTASTPRPRLS